MSIETQYKIYHNVFLSVERYMADNSIAIMAYNNEDGPIATLTKCLGDGKTYLDTNNCPWSEKFITDNNLGKLTGMTVKSGYCTYPEVRFDMDELKKHMG